MRKQPASNVCAQLASVVKRVLQMIPLCVARPANQEAYQFKLVYATGLRTEICHPGDLANHINTRLRVARRAKQDAERFKFVYVACLRTEFCPPGDPANHIKTCLRVARRWIQAATRSHLYTYWVSVLRCVLQVILQIVPKRDCALCAERARKQRASNLYT